MAWDPTQNPAGVPYTKKFSDSTRLVYTGDTNDSVSQRLIEISATDTKNKSGVIATFRRLLSFRRNWSPTATSQGASPFVTTNLTSTRSNHSEASVAEQDSQLQQLGAMLANASFRGKIINGEL